MANTDKQYTLEIDCAPGHVRPGDLLPQVLKGTGIVLGEPQSRFFGCWQWVIPPEHVLAYSENRLVIETRLRELYERGAIRFAGW